MAIARHWRLKKQRYELTGEVCVHCGAKIFPPRDICPECGHDAQTLYDFSGKGVIYSYTTVYNPPAGYEGYAPYTLALVKLEEGPLVTAQITDIGDATIEVGTPVEMVTRRLREEDDERSLLIYGYKFRPVMELQPA